MELSLESLESFLTPNPLPSKSEVLVRAWCPVLAALLSARYGDRITDELEPVFVSVAADAVQRRLDKPNRMVSTQSVNGASVGYAASLWAWFRDSELAQLDALVGIGGTRSVRMGVSDTVRLGNRVSRMPEGSSGF